MTYDFAPLSRTAIGFDRLARLMDTAVEAASAPSYPPYNIEKLAGEGAGGDRYRLTVAVAGFGPDEIELVARDNTLLVIGKPADGERAGELIYRGIAGRRFERRFVLADHIVVEGADLRNGLLHVELRRVVPDTLKPRRIAIGNGSVSPLAPSIDAPATAGNDEGGDRGTDARAA